MSVIIDYNAITNAFTDVFKAANTTTASYDLSTGLTKRVQEITNDDLFVEPKFKAKYPIISVFLDSKREDIKDFGSGTKQGRNIYLEFSVVCVLENFKEAEKELWVLVKNVDAIIRENVALANYATDVQVLAVWSTGCSFSIEFLNANISNFLFKALTTNESSFTKGAMVNVTMRCYLGG